VYRENPLPFWDLSKWENLYQHHLYRAVVHKGENIEEYM